MAAAVEFVPSDAAYFIYGHGEEVPGDLLDLTSEQVVLAKARPGESTLETVFGKWIQGLACLPPAVLNNPFPRDHMPQIVNITKSIVAFLPKEKCPNFRFSVLSYFPGGKFCSFSGIVKLGPEECAKMPRYTIEQIPLEHPAKANLLPMFEGSLFPTQEELEIKINEWETANRREMTLLDVVDDTSEFKKVFEIDLRAIFQKFGRGVIYNFVCRAIKGETVFRRLNEEGHKYDPKEYNSFLRIPKEEQNIYGRMIVEAERRKRYAPGSYLNTRIDLNPSFHNSIKQESLGLLQKAVVAGRDPNEVQEGKSPLKAVLEAKDLTFKQKAIPRLISAGANVLEPGLLELAYEKEDRSSFEELLKNGVPFLLEGVPFEDSLLHTLLSTGNTLAQDFLLILVKYIPPDFLSRPLLEGDPLIFLYLKNDILNDRVLSAILEKNPEQLSLQNAEGNTIVHSLLTGLKKELLKLVLDLGAPVDVANREGKTPIQVFFEKFLSVPVRRRHNYADMLGILLNARSPPSVLGSLGDETFLSILIKNQERFNPETLQKFIELYRAQGGPEEERLKELNLSEGGGRRRRKSRRLRKKHRKTKKNSK